MAATTTVAFLGPSPVSGNVYLLDGDDLQNTVGSNAAAQAVLTWASAVRSEALVQVAV